MAKTRVEYEFDPFALVGIDPKSLSPVDRIMVKDEIADYVKESVLIDVAEQRSPVTGRAFKALNKEYRAHKIDEGGTPVPNLELTGDLMDSLLVRKTSGNKLNLTVGDDQQPKADGHNNFSGDSLLPRRPFIPNAKDGETLRPAIRDGIRGIIEDALSNAGDIPIGD